MVLFCMCVLTLRYTCGPTVYATSHIGHARHQDLNKATDTYRTYVSFDLIARIMERYKCRRLQIRRVMGITDIDDKIIARSVAAGVHFSEVARTCEMEFVKSLRDLNVLIPNGHCNL